MTRGHPSKLQASALGILARKVRDRLLPRRLDGYRRLRAFLRGKNGLEVGGPSGMFHREGLFPVYAIAARVDNCNFGRQTTWNQFPGELFHYDRGRGPGQQYIAEATNLHELDSASYDFVISSHTLEHIANPILALSEWVRVLKDEGLFILVLPHKDGTFDHRRPVTPLQHLIEDFEAQVDEQDLTHLDEILRLHDLSRDPAAGDIAAFEQRSLRNAQNRCLHHHVFDTSLAIDLVDYVGLRILDVQTYEPFNIFIAAQKPAEGVPPENDRFRGARFAANRRSCFPSDQLGPARA